MQIKKTVTFVVEMMTEEISSLQELVKHLTKQISEQAERISELEAELLRLKTPKKNSHNSSIPPSQDPFRIKQTEHRIFRKTCTCGHCTESTYPSAVHSPVCYGERVMSLTAYMNVFIDYENDFYIVGYEERMNAEYEQNPVIIKYYFK